MFVKAIKKIEKAMFPIFRFDQISVNQSRVSVVGTGFFINTKGNFVSVAHIFNNVTLQTKFFFLGWLPDKIHNPSVEIEEIAKDDQNDIFVGRVQIKRSQFLDLSNKVPSAGETVCISGYPLASISNNPQGGLEVVGVRRYFQPSFVLDNAVVKMNNNGINIIHDGFLVRDFGLYGMSGGPVFDVSGKVFGMQASVTDPRVSSNGTNSISVQNAIAIRSNLILNFLKSKKIITGAYLPRLLGFLQRSTT